MVTRSPSQRGFTLIELSIVLVIIGLLVGGVLVGRDLIASAGVRAQISQIEKYQTAANTFRGKYGYLPGDIPEPDASRAGFAARGKFPGQGDGNGVLSGNYCNAAFCDCLSSNFACPLHGESGTFWVDLSRAGMIEESFNVALPAATPSTNLSGTGITKYLPPSKLNSGFVYVWSGGPSMWDNSPNRQNYFTVSGVTGVLFQTASGSTLEVPSMTVAQAYDIDRKIDDGLPQYGTVTANTGSANNFVGGWAAGGGILTMVGIPFSSNSGDTDTSGLYGPVVSAGDIGAVNPPSSSDWCYDGSGGLPEKYSIKINGGRGMNCYLSFKFR